ncbi:DUF559 domain-containing protein [Phycicoccus sonneratiae]|uniref:DUF559 domain-containing protein n=1 Tax=Phycicoccus sonneratiae TaxID=2807628 RepID=A0ABS2CJP0_9MICO|nr:DUF559 domain-containing protein [Phycicoccus sonneraticus]MBM6400094.1 DUF559 domain-containing protein [Phycicoccus sonneraticus]
MHPSDLPESLGSGAFSTSAARAAGVPASRLRRADLHHPTRGAHVRTVPTALVDRAAGYLAGLPDGRAFSHLTAARLHGLPLPARLEQEADDGPLHVMANTSDGHTRRRGCTGHRGLEGRSAAVVHGLPVVAPEDTWCDLGELGHRLGVDDLVVVADAVVATVRTGVPDAQWMLRRPLEARVRPRGKVRLLEALDLVRPGVRSPMETRGRLMFVRAGFPEPEVNGVVTDRHGEWLAEGDLVWREARVIGEYQGADHASRRRRSADASRRLGLEGEGWTVLEIWAEDVLVGGRRTACLLRFARELRLDPRHLQI